MPKEELKEKEGGDNTNSEPDEAENTLDKNKLLGENGGAIAELIQPNQQNSEHQYDANGDMIKKKRGRKPKSYYQQKILEEQRQRE